MFWNKRIYLETSNCRPAALCIMNTPFSVEPASIRVVLFLEAVCVGIPPCALSNQGRALTNDVCLKIVSSLHWYSSLLSLWGTAVSAIRSTAGFKNYEGWAWLLLAVSPGARSVLSPVEELTEAIARCYIWLILLQSGGQQVLVLIHLPDFSFTRSQHWQPLWDRGDHAGSVDD